MSDAGGNSEPKKLSDKPAAIYMREYNRRIKAGEHTRKARKPRGNTQAPAEARNALDSVVLTPDGYPV